MTGSRSGRLHRRLSALRRGGKKALVAYVMAGYPTLRVAEQTVRTLVAAGADIIELGVPFSDPVADGPTIQYAADQALRHAVSLDDVLALVTRLRRVTDVPILLMSYMNPLVRSGIERTVSAAARAGVDGFIVPDSVPEETTALRRRCRAAGLSVVPFVAPTTPFARLPLIDRAADSFIYVVSVAGVTGRRAANAAGLPAFLDAIGRRLHHPRFVGFGISGPAQVRALAPHCDGVIVGSALIDILRNARGGTAQRKIAIFTRGLRAALDA